MSDYENDIPLDVARAAHQGTSFVPDERGDQERASYAATLAADLAALEKIATTDEKRATLATEFARYREGFRRRFIAHLVARSRCLSWMITGPSKFPTARNEKRQRTEDRRRAELLEFRTRALAAIRKTLTPEFAPIMAGDADAVSRLRSKIEAAEQAQARMLEVNATIRKYRKAGPDAQVAALVAIGVSERAAREAIKPDELGRVGFADFETKNNGANIRRMKDRLVGLERAKASPAEPVVEGKHGALEVVPAENRVRVYFPWKPTPDVRARLKAGGFRWAPTVTVTGMPREGCWSAYINPGSLEIARREAGVEGAKTL